MERVKKLAQMHQRYGGIIIDVIDSHDNQVLVRLTDRKGELSPEQLVQKANEVFVGEVPDNVVVYYTLMQEDSKYYLTWDHKFVVRVHKYFMPWVVSQNEKGELFIKEPPILYLDPVVDSGNTETEKARKWLKNYAITHKIKAI